MELLIPRRKLLLATPALILSRSALARSLASSVDPYIMPELQGYPAGNSNNAGRSQQLALTADTTSVIVIASDSICANTINATLTPTQAKNQNFDVYNGAVYTTANPMLSCGTNAAALTSSSVMSLLADALITAGTKQRIIGVPLGVGGALTADWASFSPGQVAGRFAATKRRLDSVGLTASAIVVCLGTNDGPNGTSGASLAASWSSIISNISNAGFACKIFVPIASMFGGTTFSTVTTAQNNIINGSTIINGGNFDTGVPVGNRWDGTHFNTTGAGQASGLLQTAITPFL